jgi:hypothetical protein
MTVIAEQDDTTDCFSAPGSSALHRYITPINEFLNLVGVWVAQGFVTD